MSYRENLINCFGCNRSFNNHYKNGKYKKLYCSKKCYDIFRKKYLLDLRKEQRVKLKIEHKCINCKAKVKPIIIYHQYCEKHRTEENERKKKRKIKWEKKN